MNINLNDYKVILPSIKAIVESNEGKSPSELASVCAVATQAPCIVCCYYISSFIGMSPELQKTIENLTAFYRYSDIIGAEEFV